MEKRDRIVEAILEIELAMFLTVNSRKTSCCQDYPEEFKLNRRAQFAPWSMQTLSSYLEDVQAAQSAGINLMRQKYARMQGLAGNENSHPIIDEILPLAMNWQKEMFRKYPGIMSGARPLTDNMEADRMTSFETYTRGELETYSLRTLRLLHSDMILMRERGLNWSEAIYESLVQGSGYSSLEEAERCQKSAPHFQR